jgi:hypothetical protein
MDARAVPSRSGIVEHDEGLVRPCERRRRPCPDRVADDSFDSRLEYAVEMGAFGEVVLVGDGEH